jgi:4-hydroxybenzoate polyprenyltransferase
MTNAFLRLIDGFFVLRPVVLIPVWGFALFGYYQGKGLSLFDISACWSHPEIIPFSMIMVFSLSVGCVYVLNQIADIAADRENGGFPLLASGVVSLPQAYVAASLSALLSILLPLLTGYLTLALLSIAAIITGLLYSFKPTYFSGRPFLDFLANAFGFGMIAFACGWYCSGNQFFTLRFFNAALPYFFLMCAGSISSTIPDILGDRATGKKTTAVLLGARNAHVLALVFLCLATIDSLFVKDLLALFCSGASLPIYILYHCFPKKILEESTYKIGGALCMFAAALFTPWFIIFGCATAFATWMYFRYRHHVSYPSLVPLKSHRIPSA